jgi:hypothetical protein
MEFNWELIGEQQYNGCYELSDAGIALAEKINQGTKLELMDGTIKTVTDVYKDLPRSFYFKCDLVLISLRIPPNFPR